MLKPHHSVAGAMFLLSFGMVLFELALTRLFGVVLFASFAHLALALAMLGIGLGAVLQHLWPQLVPDRGLERRLALLGGLQAISTFAATWACATLPLTHQFDEVVLSFAERSSIAWDLVDPVWFSLLMVLLTVPFTVVGLAFAGTFQRRKEHIGLLYGADLLGGAVGALAFLPLLAVLPAPDVSWVVMAAAALSSVLLLLADGARHLVPSPAALLVVSLGAVGWAASGHELLRVRYAAGFSEQNIVYRKWTPLTRIAVHDDEIRGPYAVLDNTSASRIITTDRARKEMAAEAPRGMVFALHDPPAHVAILAASAGPEVATAQSYGYSDIDAIDIAAEISDMVATQFADKPINPYLQPGVNRVWSDGRAAILHADRPYDIILMVHANLHSAAGLLANAWSPNLLGTKEAFRTYLEHLTPDGTISFGAGGWTRAYARSAAEALKELGAERPSDHIVYIEGRATVMLVKKRPWTQAERDRIVAIAADQATWGKEHLRLDPVNRDLGEIHRMLESGAVMTDDRPYMESPSEFLEATARVARRLGGDTSIQAEPVDVVYGTLLLQTLFTLIAGSLLVVVPLARRGPSGLTDVKGTWAGLLYVCGLGYGYLAVETVLIHELVLYVGHPTYAVTVVIFTMLLFSGLGSLWVGRMDEDALTARLRAVLGAVLVLGALQTFVVPPVLYAMATGLPVAVRLLVVGGLLAPLGLVMGMPFPLGMRLLRPEAAGLVPWAWAFNGWTSVVASLLTVFVSRLVGYHAAFGLAMVAYGVALLVAGRLRAIGR